ncbi:MAG TPA: hypothetical protein PKX23_12105, partial [Verrucomicrobiota bacterium]|nr:hypothetical protein [Verrucomicrobiota bacterium]
MFVRARLDDNKTHTARLMKTLERFRSFDSLFCLACSTCSLLLLGGATLPGATVWFTQDTVISAMDTNYDGAEVSISNCTVTVSGAHRFARLHLLTGATLTHPHNGTEVPAGLNLLVDGDLLIESGARVDVSGRGYPAGTGPGAGKPALYGSVGGSGGGYGGYGGAGGTNADTVNVGGVYGAVAAPALFGSGGGRGYLSLDLGGSGGGVVRLEVGHLLLVDGIIVADGAAGTNRASGGGSGGSIWLVAQTLGGAGAISANGGAGEPGFGGGGGGGRIAISCTNLSFSGSVMARGGSGRNSGGPGTVYRQIGTPASISVSVENGERLGYTALLPDLADVALSLGGGAMAGVSGDKVLSSLVIRSNSYILLTN